MTFRARNVSDGSIWVFDGSIWVFINRRLPLACRKDWHVAHALWSCAFGERWSPGQLLLARRV